MSVFFALRIFAVFFGVLSVLSPGFWYLYYRRITPKLTREHVPQATRTYVRNRCVHLGVESALSSLGYSATCYSFSLAMVSAIEHLAWLIVGIVSAAVCVAAQVAMGVSSVQLHQALQSVGQSEV